MLTHKDDRMSSLRRLCLIVVLLLATAAHAADPLPSWRDTSVKAAVLQFVATVTDTASADFVPVAERIAVLDNDGTSWCERPGFVPTAFQVGLLRGLVDRGEVDGTVMPHSAWLADDRDALREFGWSAAYDALNTAFAGMPVAAYRDSARAFLARERHPVYGVPHTELYYTPMRELARLLEDRGFQVWIVTGGEQAFVRSYIEEAFGIPPEHVIGSWTRPVYDRDELTMVRGVDRVYNGHQEKPANIDLRIGRRPIFAVGNSNNDEPMCPWSVSGERPALALWIHHDDPDREYEYDRGTSRIARLASEHPHAYEVSMARDWARVFDGE